jgi:hypothetical protein
MLTISLTIVAYEKCIRATVNTVNLFTKRSHVYGTIERYDSEELL